MFLKKKWLMMLAVITTALLLVACGDKEKTGQPVDGDNQIYDNPRNHTAEDFMPISEGLEEYSVWFKVWENPGEGLGRNSSIREVIVFDNGEVTKYFNMPDAKLSLEKIIDLTDEEIIQRAKEASSMKYSGKYTLDITLDRLGQYTEKIDVILKDGTSVDVFPLEDAWAESAHIYESKDEYIAELKADETKQLEGENIIATKKFEDDRNLITFESGAISETIFDTTFSGLQFYEEDYVLLTKVDDSFIGFKLDDPDTDKKNVTIEGK